MPEHEKRGFATPLPTTLAKTVGFLQPASWLLPTEDDGTGCRKIVIDERIDDICNL